jgi:hypothetical protein
MGELAESAVVSRGNKGSDRLPLGRGERVFIAQQDLSQLAQGCCGFRPELHRSENAG